MGSTASSVAKGKKQLAHLEKTPTGITGFDEVTFGGLPRGRISLVSGGPGTGKTLFAMEFLVRGAEEYGEPGVFMAFEETEDELAQNVAGLGFDVEGLVKQGLLMVDFIFIDRSEFEETGEFDLEGLFLRLGLAIDSVGAKRVVLDTIETLFAGLPNEAIVRSEVRRLFRWLKDRGVTAVVTGERGETTITRYGLEEFVSDCVIMLDHRVDDQLSTRRMRVVKYRGSPHGANEFPFIISETGIAVLPITSITLSHTASTDRVPTGIEDLDAMLGGKGYYKGASVLVSGTAGTGKSSMVASFVDATCSRGDKALIFAFEESPDQIIRNMRSIGIDLAQWIEKGLLRIDSTRPTMYGMETHLANFHIVLEEFEPDVVAFDPVTNFSALGSTSQVTAMLARLIDYLKTKSTTVMFTTLTAGGDAIEASHIGASSLMDTWILLRDREVDNNRKNLLCILKSRGMVHSRMVSEFLFTDGGIRLGPAPVEQ